jgi:anti-sigma regulatory factor (Ser/Thr protein kinase)
MATRLDVTVPATTKGRCDALVAIERSCAAWNLDRDLVSRVLIIVEELFSNTVKYGYGGECERPVRFGLSTDPVLTLVYEDDAPPFDPTLWRRAETADVAADQRPEGQAGILLIMGLSATAHYLPRPAGNCLTVTFEI